MRMTKAERQEQKALEAEADKRYADMLEAGQAFMKATDAFLDGECCIDCVRKARDVWTKAGTAWVEVEECVIEVEEL